MLAREYSYPVWGTQGGGLAREVNGTYIFIKKPHCPGFDVGDEVPREWGLAAANQSALESSEFGRGVEGLFDVLFAKAAGGEIDLKQIGDFFPDDVR